MHGYMQGSMFEVRKKQYIMFREIPESGNTPVWLNSEENCVRQRFKHGSCVVVRFHRLPKAPVESCGTRNCNTGTNHPEGARACMRKNRIPAANVREE